MSLFNGRSVIKAGATTYLITPENNAVKASNHDHWTKSYKVNATLKTAKASDYDALILPGGVLNPDKLRTYKSAVTFINQFIKAKKPIAAICHGPLTLIETNKLKGLKMTSYPSIKTDLINAGVKWENKKVVVDKNFVTSRKPSDIPAFNKAIISLLAKSAKLNRLKS